MKRVIFPKRPKKIPDGTIRIVHEEITDGVLEFDWDPDLDNLGLLKAGRIFVDAHTDFGHMRFDFGTVGQIRKPGSLVLDDPEVVASGEPEYRISVVDPDNQERLAEGRWLSGRDPGGKDVSLLPIKPVDLPYEVFRLSIPALDTIGKKPVLEINRELQELKYRPFFQSLVVPQALRTILGRILYDPFLTVEEDSEDWASQWCRLLCTILGEPFSTIPVGTSAGEERYRFLEDEGNREKVAMFIEHAVGKFATIYRFDSRMKRELEQGL